MSWFENKATDDYAARMAAADAVADRWQFRRDGIVGLPMTDVSGIAELFTGAAEREGSLLHYPIETILKVPALRTLAMGAGPREIAAAHLGLPAKIVDVSVWRSAPGEAMGAQTWHRDRDDWRACKLFCYLTAVGDDSGPHAYVVGSHRPGLFEDAGHDPNRWFKGNGRQIAHEVEQVLPHLVITGPAGTTWMEQTYGFHRGLPPITGDRLVFQVCYAQTIYPHMATKAGSVSREWGDGT